MCDDMKKETALAVIRSDYYSALADFGISHQEAQRQTEDHSDLIDSTLPGVEVGDSEIHGRGLFARTDFPRGSFICIARKGISRTLAGRYTNHAPCANAVFSFVENDIILVALDDIAAGDEIAVDYRQALALQINQPGAKDMLAPNGEIALSNTDRLHLSGTDAAVYDLLFNSDHANNLTVRERVLAFERVLASLPQEHIEPNHEFIDGLYRREITFKAGTMATGRIHRDDHMDVVLSGEMVVATEGGFEHIKGPCFRTSRAGRKKAGYALTDVVWATYHPTDCTTVDAVEKELFTEEFEDINISFQEVEAPCQE